ncbi:MAG TPA: serine hydrolase domain-containing protein [Patescibacteria group bacterium]|nr:serine hydrolase domain-containing protein [Patescibacteria group bacterium]
MIPDERTPEELVESLDGLIPDLMIDEKVPGLSIAVIEGAEVTWKKGYGVRSASSSEPMTPRTVFSAQSLSKPVAAYAAMKLCEGGFMELDVPLESYLSSSFIPGVPQLRRVTMRHVLSHSSGLPNWPTQGGPLKLLFEPGEGYSYSGFGFVYLQVVMGHLTGRPFEEHVAETLLKPLGLEGSSFVWRDEFEAGAEAHGRDAEPLGIPRMTEANAAASLYTTPREYARVMIAMMRPTGGNSCLSEASTMEMLRPQVRVDDSQSRGLGWGIYQTASGDLFGQHGKQFPESGYQHLAVASRELKRGVVVMTNGGDGLKACKEGVRELFGLDELTI